MDGLGFDLRNEAHLRTLTEDVVKSSEIEGEMLLPDQVRSSIARRLGLHVAGLVPADRNVDGVVEMMVDATSKYQEPLSKRQMNVLNRVIDGFEGKLTSSKWAKSETDSHMTPCTAIQSSLLICMLDLSASGCISIEWLTRRM